MTNEESAWLAGFWDGEGTITVFKHKEKTGWKLCPTMCIVNTDPNLINQTQKLCEKIGVQLALFTRNPKKKEHAISYQLNTRNMEYILKLIETIKPYLVGKLAQAEITERFTKSRLKHRTNGGRPLPYTDKEWKMSEDLYVLNAKGVSRALNDYVLDTQSGEDIV